MLELTESLFFARRGHKKTGVKQGSLRQLPAKRGGPAVELQARLDGEEIPLSEPGTQEPPAKKLRTVKSSSALLTATKPQEEVKGEQGSCAVKPARGHGLERSRGRTPKRTRQRPSS